MIAYKGMEQGMICRGYQLKMGLNITEQANCQANGFHCAANPMDCLRYYGDFQNSEYYLVRPCGDLDEDAVDSRISCTQLWVLRKLEPQEFSCTRLHIWQTIHRCRMAGLSKEIVRRRRMDMQLCAVSTHEQREILEIFWRLPERLQMGRESSIFRCA